MRSHYTPAPSTELDPISIDSSGVVTADADNPHPAMETTKNFDFDFLLTEKKRRNLTRLSIAFAFTIALIALVLSIVAITHSKNGDDDMNRRQDLEVPFQKNEQNQGRDAKGEIQRSHLISRIGFGSCTTYYLHPEPIWTHSVIPSKLDMWIWMGDFVYADDPIISCKLSPNATQCNCPMTVKTYPPYFCMAGNFSHATERFRLQPISNLKTVFNLMSTSAFSKAHRVDITTLPETSFPVYLYGSRNLINFCFLKLADPDYQNFLEYMCPGFKAGRKLPPEGPSCKRPILGTYDDHDFVFNNGNRELQKKAAYKNLFLDAIGEPEWSTRRSATYGLQFKYTINPDEPIDKQIDVFLLDERFERDPLPCNVRRSWCEDILKNKPDPMTHDYLWCDDFLNTGGPLGVGSCCKADEEWALGWCKDNADAKDTDPLWDIACDPASVRFGSIPLEVDEATNKLRQRVAYDDLATITYKSNFCDVLGPKQRQWLQTSLKASKAPLKLIVSGSVMFGNPNKDDEPGRPCSGDDIECYKTAQSNLMHILGRVDNGCVAVLAGDYHISDLKMLRPGNDTGYYQHYPTDALSQPIYQVMSSGLTNVTASSSSKPNVCSGWRKDNVGMRVYGNCSFVTDPAFGFMEVNWKKRTVMFQHRAEYGGLAKSVDGSKQELNIDLDTCQLV